MQARIKQTRILTWILIVSVGLLMYQGIIQFSDPYIPLDLSLKGNDSTSINIPIAQSDPSGNLTLEMSTFLGAAGVDDGYAIAVDNAGDIYIAGITDSTIFPTKNALNSSYNGGLKDAFLAKFFKNETLAFSTYFGGSGRDGAYSIAVNTSGIIYLTGYTDSPNFPTTANAFNKTLSGTTDRFISQFTTDGQLIYSTYFGGKQTEWIGNDRFYDLIEIDENGSIYIAGLTNSSYFPTTTNANDTSYNGGIWDTFVAKFYANWTLAYSSYCGGSGSDTAIGLGVDKEGGIYITGTTDSANFPTAQALNATPRGNGDAFVTYFSPNGSIPFSTYWGGSQSDAGYGLDVDQNGTIVFTGFTYSSNFPIKDSFDPALYGCGGDSFVSTILINRTVGFSTYIGGTLYDMTTDIEVDSDGTIYLTGYTDSSDFPILNAYDPNMSDYARDVFVSIFQVNGSLKYSTFIGSEYDADQAYSLAIDSTGKIYVCGSTISADYPTTAGAYDTTHNTSMDAFLSILSLPKNTTVPAAPLLSINAPTSATGEASLSWTMITDALAYKLYRSTAAITQVSGLTPMAPNLLGTTYIDTGLTNGTYYYAIVAFNANGDSNASNCVQILVAISPPNNNSTNGTQNNETAKETPPFDEISGFPVYWIGFSVIAVLIVKSGKYRKSKQI